ncbi:unnamed protein product [Diamesa hyperborea]
MESTTEKSCLEEISHLVIDSEEKVSLKTISNNWEITNEVAKDVLKKWLDQNEKKVKQLVKEYLVRGINSDGKFFICVVSEEKKDKLAKKWKSFISWLYSIESNATSRTLNVSDHNIIQVKNILIESGTRDISVPDIPIIKVESSTSKSVKPSPFAPKPSVAKKEVEIKKEPEAKKELDSKKKPSKTGMFAAADKKEKETKTSPPQPKKEKSPEVKEVKVEKTSPSEDTSQKKSPTKKGLKNQKPVSKGSITSFFTKPSASASKSTIVKSAPEKSQDVKQETSSKTSEKTPEPKKKLELKVSKKEEPKKKPEAKEVKKVEPKKSVTPASKKRSLPDSDEEIPATPEEPRTRKKQAKLRLKDPPPKRSRIKAIVDSSDEEEEVDSEKDEPESKFIKFYREFTPELEESTPMEIEDSPPKVSPKKNGNGTTRNHRKAKRTVKKRYETEDGYMRTDTVIEEYTASEDENDENEKQNSSSTTDKKQTKSDNTTEKKSIKSESSTEKKAKAAAAAVANSKTKQGSIMSFFQKK